jgi:hypothetical protein
MCRGAARGDVRGNQRPRAKRENAGEKPVTWRMIDPRRPILPFSGRRLEIPPGHLLARSLIVSMEWTDAGRAHDCRHSKHHRIEKASGG